MKTDGVEAEVPTTPDVGLAVIVTRGVEAGAEETGDRSTEAVGIEEADRRGAGGRAGRASAWAPRRPARVVVGAVALLVGMGALRSAPRADGGDTDPRDAVATLASEVDLLEKNLELAKGEQFYLLVDPAARTLKLMLQGAVLRDYPILRVEVGTPRIAFRERAVSHGWAGRLWDGGELLPPRERERLEIEPPDSTEVDSTSTPPLPPTPEEAYPVPHRYLVRYAGGLSLEVRPEALDSSVTTWKRVATTARVWVHDLPATLRRHPEDTVRLRLVLRPEDAESLYRALPPDTRLLVLPPSS